MKHRVGLGLTLAVCAAVEAAEPAATAAGPGCRTRHRSGSPCQQRPPGPGRETRATSRSICASATFANT